MGVRKPDEEKRLRISITVHPKTWKDFQAFCERVGMTPSRYIEILMRANTLAESEPMQGVMEGIFEDLVDADKNLKKIERDKTKQKVRVKLKTSYKNGT